MSRCRALHLTYSQIILASINGPTGQHSPPFKNQMPCTPQFPQTVSPFSSSSLPTFLRGRLKNCHCFITTPLLYCPLRDQPDTLPPSVTQLKSPSLKATSGFPSPNPEQSVSKFLAPDSTRFGRCQVWVWPQSKSSVSLSVKWG